MFISLSILIYIHCITRHPGIDIWDIQTGVAINYIDSEITGKITFFGDCGIITVTNGGDFFICDRLNGGRLHKGQLQPPNHHKPYVQWVHKESLQFATSHKTNGKLAINIQGFQPSSNPLSFTAKSFPVPFLNGEFSFSPVSFHASFVTETEVVIVDVQGSKILLNTKTTELLYNPPGQFSPNGSFLACKTLGNNIHIWRNTPTGYVPWSALQPRLKFDDFSFSPTATSVLTWGEFHGIQVLHPENSVSSPSLNEMKPLYQQRAHLVACSADGSHIVIAQQDGNVVTVLDSLLGTMIHSIHVGVEIQAIRIVDDTLLVAGRHRLISWNLGAGDGATVGGSSHDIITMHMDGAHKLALSIDCSKMAFAFEQTTILYNITAQAVLIKCEMYGTIQDIKFSQDGNLLYVWSCDMSLFGNYKVHLTKFETGGDGCLVRVTKEWLEDRKWDSFFLPSQRYHPLFSKWVSDPSGHKCLWLPPHWRSKEYSDVEYEHNFLALVGSHYQKPIIIELQPLPIPH